MKIKIAGGTVEDSSTNLCSSCRYASIRQGAGVSQEYVSCSQMEDPRYPIKKCSAYINRDTPLLDDMKAIAWVLRTDESRKKIGFIHVDQWKKEHKNEDITPDVEADGRY